MKNINSTQISEIAQGLAGLYKDLHQHPELSFAEHRTAGIIAEQLESLGLEVLTGIGGTGVVGVLRNGDGPVAALRADMDGLLVAEETGLDYASTARGTDPAGNDVPVMHACGHDMHVASLLGAVRYLAAARNDWSGTLVAVFQPAEEAGGGAEAMIADGLWDKAPRPDIVLGQHVAPAPAGMVGLRSGAAFAGADTITVRLFGRGGHGSRPETTVDPVVMAAGLVLRLQTIISRETTPGQTAVLTVGQLHAGTKSNIIPGHAELGLTVRSTSTQMRERILSSIERMAKAEALAAGAEREPEISYGDSFPVLVNDPEATAAVKGAFSSLLGAEQVLDPGLVSGSEDVSVLATAAGAPLVYWVLGGLEPQAYLQAVQAGTAQRDIPSNHSARFAPVITPTLETGISALAAAALAGLSVGGALVISSPHGTPHGEDGFAIDPAVLAAHGHRISGITGSEPHHLADAIAYLAESAGRRPWEQLVSTAMPLSYLPTLLVTPPAIAPRTAIQPKR